MTGVGGGDEESGEEMSGDKHPPLTHLRGGKGGRREGSFGGL